MKRLFFLLTLATTLSATSAQAQSLDALLKGLSSLLGTTTTEEPAQAAPKITHPEIYELIGRWDFDTLVMDYTGDSTLAGVAISTLESQLPALASKFGLVAGRDYINIGEDGSVTFVCGENRITAHCNSYDSYDGAVDLTFYLNGKTVYVSGVVMQQDGQIKVLFNANKVMGLLSQNYSKFNENTILQAAKSVIDSYTGIRVGATVKPHQ